MAKTAVATRHVLLLRGVNVGGHKKVPMADLRRMLEAMGHTNVRTLLNSGNAVFDVGRASTRATLERDIESAITDTFGFSARPFVLTAADLEIVVRENPLAEATDNPSRLMVAYVAIPADRERLLPLVRQSWDPEAIAVGEKAAYVWCPRSVIDSGAFEAVTRVLKTGVTTRNWATTLKLQALCREG